MAKRKRKIDGIQLFRRIVLAFFIVLVTFMAVMHQLSVPGFGPVDALCPFGGIETLYKLLAGGAFISKTFTSNIVLLAGIVILGILFARYFCGWICMFGGLQEYFALLGKKLTGKRYDIPSKIDKPLRYLKYAVLFVVLFLTWKAADLIIRPYDPFVAYAHLAGGLRSVWDEFAIGFIILILSMAGSMFYDRVFCKYLCPLGAFLGLLSKVSLYRIKREDSTCTHCKRCDKLCPVNIDISTKPAITSAECINCLECVTDCPTNKNTLFSTVSKKFVSSLKVAVLGILIYVGTIGASKLTGYWESANQTLEQRAEEGLLSPDDIKGSNSLREVADNFNISMDELYRKLDIDRELVPEDTRLKDIKYLIPERPFEAEEVRAAVRSMLGISVPDEYVPEKSGQGSEQKVETGGNMFLDTNIIPAQPVRQGSGAGEMTGTGSEQGFELEGTMTIREVAKALQLTEQTVIEKLGLPSSISVDRPLRDMREEYGYTMPELKERMNQ